jgi:ATP-dependent Clp protease ATP-binding subunit ClpA
MPRELVALMQLIAEAPLIKSLFSEEAQELIDVHIRLSSLQGVSNLGKFSWSMQRVLAMAQEEANQLNHNYIGTGHILLALSGETEGKAWSLLFAMEAYRERLRSTVERIIDRSEKPSQGEIGLTPQAKKAFELAEDEANGMNLHYVGTEHLLIGLLRERERVAARALGYLGATIEKVRSYSAYRYSTEPIPKLDDDQ